MPWINIAFRYKPQLIVLLLLVLHNYLGIMVNNYLILCLKGLHCFFFILLQVVQHVHEMNGGVLMEIAF